MTKEQKSLIIEQLAELSGEQVVDLFIDYHGTQIITEDFMNHCINESAIDGYDITCDHCGDTIGSLAMYRENGCPECKNCHKALCPSCIVNCSDENDRCQECADNFHESAGCDTCASCNGSCTDYKDSTPGAITYGQCVYWLHEAETCYDCDLALTSDVDAYKGEDGKWRCEKCHYEDEDNQRAYERSQGYIL